MMRKCIISLLFSIFFLASSSQNHLTAQVYNQKTDKRFDSAFKTEQAYYKFITQKSTDLYADYHSILKQLVQSKVPHQMELLRKDKLKALEDLRYTINSKKDYDPKFPLKKTFNILIDRYEDVYQNELKDIIGLYFIKEQASIEAEKKALLEKGLISEKVKTKKKDIFKTDLRDLATEFDLRIDTLPIAKEYVIQLKNLQTKASHARNEFEEIYSAFEQEYSLAPEVEDDFETYTKLQVKHYQTLKRLELFEKVNVYIVDIFTSVHKLESIDKDFRLAVRDYDITDMRLRRKYMNHHAQNEYNKLKTTEKFEGKEGDFRSASTRLIKYYQSSGKNTYPKVIDFIQKNEKALIQEKANKEEFDLKSKDPSMHKSKEEYKEYLNFPPPQKYTDKLELLIKKYRERVQDSTDDFILTLEELRVMFTKDFDPLDN